MKTIALFFLAASFTQARAADEYKIDPAHTGVEKRDTHLKK